MIGKLQRVPLREVWGSEPNDFTPWLAENIEELYFTLSELALFQKSGNLA